MADLPFTCLLQTQVLDRLSYATSYFVFLMDNWTAPSRSFTLSCTVRIVVRAWKLLFDLWNHRQVVNSDYALGEMSTQRMNGRYYPNCGPTEFHSVLVYICNKDQSYSMSHQSQIQLKVVQVDSASPE